MEPTQKRRIRIPSSLSESDRENLGEDIITYIRNRTQSGKDIDNKPFADYSKSYTDSLDFQNAGKSASTVDLSLSEDMLEAIEILDSGNGYITIGYEEGTPENDKAAWNQREKGYKKCKSPARKFLGISDADLSKLLSEYKDVKDE